MRLRRALSIKNDNSIKRRVTKKKHEEKRILVDPERDSSSGDSLLPLNSLGSIRTQLNIMLVRKKFIKYTNMIAYLRVLYLMSSRISLSTNKKVCIS